MSYPTVEQAIKVFEGVSRADPNTIPGQAIRMAIICQARRWDPYMIQAGIFNSGAIPNLVEEAMKQHEKHGVTVEVTEDNMQRIIDAECSLADRLLRLDRETLVSLKGYSRRLKQIKTRLQAREYLLYEAIKESFDEKESLDRQEPA